MTGFRTVFVTGAGGASDCSAARQCAAVLTLALAVCAGVVASAGDARAADKIKLQKLDDLPRHTYPIQGSASELLASREKLMALAAQVKRDTQATLDTYDIQDRNTLQGLYGVLQTISYLEGDEAKTREYLEKSRSLEEKEAARLTAGMFLLAHYDARRETGKGPDAPEYRASFRKKLEGSLGPLPWGTVQDNVEQMKGNLEILSEAIVMGMVTGTIDPAVAKSGQLSGEVAAQLLAFRQAMDLVIPLKAEAVAVLDAYVRANRVEKADIWAARSVTLDPAPGTKVRVGVWDTGVDVKVFEGSLWTNPKETMNGKDDDGNGFVDDVHGIAHDKDHQRSPLLLYPLGDAEGRRSDLEGMFKGLFDLQAALDSPEAKALRARLSSLAPTEASTFMEDLGLYTHHAHGTHVAGIALAGNQRAEVVVARLGTDHRLVPEPPTMASTEAFAKELQDTVDYFKAAGARVVNMSWVLFPKGFEDDLEKNGVGKDQAERAAMARAMFAVAKDALRKAFESAPEIVFVGGAGNSDNDVNFDEFIPPAFDLPNLVIAGAVDQAGDATGFTSFGKGVDVYSNGFEVDSFVPGGHRMKLSGTSMASPNVANLAAKLIALDPSLTPPQVIDLIRRGAEPRGEKGELLVINPKESVRLLEERRKERG